LDVANSVPWVDFNGRLEPGAKAFDVRRALTKKTLKKLIREYKTRMDQADERKLYGVKVRDRAEKLDTKIADIVNDA
jgi:hypothetical protein